MNTNTTPRRMNWLARSVFLFVAVSALSAGPKVADDSFRDARELASRPVRLFEESKDFHGVAFSPDAKYIAAGGGTANSPGDVELYDVASRKRLWRLRELIGVASVAFSADGKRLAWAGWGERLRAIDVESRKEVFSVRVPGRNKRVSYSPDGKWLAVASEDGVAQLRDPATGKVVHSFAGDKTDWYCLAFSADGKRLATSGGSFARPENNFAVVWDVATRKRLARLDGHTRAVIGVAFAPGGAFIATASADQTVRIWDGKTYAIKAVLKGHTNPVKGLAFSSDGKTLATGSWDRSIRLWNVTDGKELATLEGHPRAVREIAVSPDGQWLLSGGGLRSLKLWDLKARKEWATLSRLPEEKDQPAPVAMAVSRDGQWVALGLDSGVVSLRNTTSEDVSFTLKGHEDAVTTLDFSPDGKWLATAGTDTTVRLWSTATGKEQKQFKGHDSWVFVVRFSPDGKWLATGSYDKTIRLYDLTGKAAARSLAGHRASVRTVAFSADGKQLASGSADRAIRVWGLDDFASKQVLRGHQGTVRGLAFSADGSGLFSAGEDGLLKSWDLESGKERKSAKVLDVPSGDNQQVLALALSPGGKVIATGLRWGYVQLWSAEDLKKLSFPFAHAGGVLALAYRFDGQQLFTLGEDRAVCRWDARETPVKQLDGHKGPVRVAVFSPDGKRVVSGGGWPDGDKTVKLWDVATGKVIREFKGIDRQVSAAGYSPDGKFAVAGFDNGRVLMWEVETGKQVREFKGHTDGVQQVTFSRDGSRLLTASHDRTVRLWGTGTGEELRVLKGHTDWVRSAVFLPGEEQVLSGGRDKTVRLWRIVGGKLLKTLDHGEAVEGLAALSDGKRFLSAGGQAMRLWDIESGRVLQEYLGHLYGITGVALAGDDRTVLTVSYDGSTRLWNVKTGDELYRFGGHRNWVWSVAWAPDGTHFLTAGGGGSANGKFVAGTDFSIRLWRVPARLLVGEK